MPQPVQREPKAGGEPSLAHAYQIRAETEKREREEAQRRAQLREHAEPGAFALRGILGGQQRRAAAG